MNYRPNIIFLVILIFICWSLSLYYENVVMSGSVLSRQERAYRSLMGEGEIKYLFLGDSHTINGIIPALIDPQKRSFNYGVTGESIVETYYKLKHILKKERRAIDTVVLPADLHTYSSVRFTTNSFHSAYYWHRYIDYVELGLYKNDLLAFLNKYIEGALFPYIGKGQDFADYFSRWRLKGGSLSDLLTGDDSVSEDLGYEESRLEHVRGREMHKSAIIRSNIYFKDKDPMERGNVDYFLKIIDLCVEEGVNVAVVSMPVTQEYYSYAIGEIKNMIRIMTNSILQIS